MEFRRPTTCCLAGRLFTNISGDYFMSKWSAWANKMLSAGNATQVLRVANLGRGIDVLDRNQRRVERMANAYSPATATESEGPEDDSMGVHFGDVMKSERKSLALPLIAGAALGGLIPTAAIGGFMLAKSLIDDPAPATATQDQQDETVTIGLGKIDDYLRSDE